VSLQTPKDLAETLKRLSMGDTDGKTAEDYNYILYLRKSTKEKENKQVASLGDQLTDCREEAERLGLTIGKIVKEAQSAKEPDIRPKFRWMLDQIKAGKYDGILSWHPNRLSRNMKEAGEIIDLIDKGIIKDLKFKSFTFVNDPGGKMMLGLTFVMSKQYSDNLSKAVLRGVHNRMEEGKYLGKSKHGYYKDRNGNLQPDGENFQLISQMFELRLAGKSQKDIGTYLQKQGYPILTANVKRMSKRQRDRWLNMKIDDKFVSRRLSDPFYAGVIMYGDEVCDLTEQYDLMPIVSVEDFLKLNKISNINKAFKAMDTIKPKEAMNAPLLRQMVLCGDCGETRTSSVTTKKRDGEVYERRLLYRCDTEHCVQRGKSVRAKTVVDWIKESFKDTTLATPEAYEDYSKQSDVRIKKREREIAKSIKSLRQRETNLKGRMQTTLDAIKDEDDPAIKRLFKEDAKKSRQALKDLRAEVKKTEQLQLDVKEAKMSLSDFLELFNNIAKTLDETTRQEVLDDVARAFYLNFTVTGKKVTKVTTKPPFGGLLGHGTFRDGEPNQSRVEHLGKYDY